MQPYLDLEASALAGIRTLRSANRPVSDVNRERALGALEADLQKLYPDSVRNLSTIIDEMSALVRAGRPLAAIHEELSTKYNDGPSKVAIGDLVSAIRAEILKAPQLSRVAAFNKAAANLGNLLKIAKIMNPDSGDPLAAPRLNQLADLIDVSKAGVGRHPVGYALGMYGLIVDDIAGSTRIIQHRVALNNIQGLIEGGLRRQDPYGDLWLGLNPEVIFGLPLPNPAIVPDKTSYEEGEGITGKWYGSIRYDESGWVGIVPAGTPDHETWADSKDLDYARIVSPDERGDFNFRSDLQPGNYELRMYENDSGGELLARQSVSITSKKEREITRISDAQAPDLSGIWIGRDYSCDGQAYSEEVSFSQEGDQIIAIKRTGDPCVLAGDVTFKARINGGADCHAGTPENPSSSIIRGTFVLRSTDRVEVCGGTFVRQRAKSEASWETSEGDMDLPESLNAGQQVRAKYNQDGGRIVAQLSNGSNGGLIMSGHWIETASSRKCPGMFDGSYYWGTISFVFDATREAFAGLWGYCDDAPTNIWTGQKR